jgi:hypothetical protein
MWAATLSAHELVGLRDHQRQLCVTERCPCRHGAQFRRVSSAAAFLALVAISLPTIRGGRYVE